MTQDAVLLAWIAFAVIGVAGFMFGLWRWNRYGLRCALDPVVFAVLFPALVYFCGGYVALLLRA